MITLSVISSAAACVAVSLECEVAALVFFGLAVGMVWLLG
jgi:hypothetical protein